MSAPVAVLYGGPSAERAISLKSGEAVAGALERRGHAVARIDAGRDLPERLRESGADRAWVALHGPFGEDGVVQGCLETMGLAYTGSGVLGSALAMDKLRSKRVWQAAELPTPPVVDLGLEPLETVPARLGWPVMVKPARSGSSLGMARADGPEALRTAWESARSYDDTVFAESWVDGVEVTVGVLEGEALPVLRLEVQRGFYDYTAKYESGAGTQYLHPTGLGAEVEEFCQSVALDAFRALDCRGWGRVDMMVGESGVQVIEVNTIPGMTEHSLVPKAAAHAGIGFDELVERILGAAVRA
ncbi:D-alanine--D-alanine ligase [Thiohalorhabdus methylotrophus]|uniref:D-alanine--D-alanine ligase n=1 Tax=Thiohalorhabdus methylotrophus TaxID=3242694 RepID=A0ABV4TVP7_9GAMM